MPKAPQFDGGLTCALSVKDLERSLAWYREVLGFELLFKLDHVGWAEVKTAVPGVTIGMSEVETMQPGGGGATLTFGVVDIAAARSAVEAHGVRFDGPTREIPEMVKLATFYDPDGNTLMFYQDLMPKK
jgi:predicted enzyme related to lactoylglutathione lyase